VPVCLLGADGNGCLAIESQKSSEIRGIVADIGDGSRADVEGGLGMMLSCFRTRARHSAADRPFFGESQ
jgi:hypothetical protein